MHRPPAAALVLPVVAAGALLTLPSVAGAASFAPKAYPALGERTTDVRFVSGGRAATLARTSRRERRRGTFELACVTVGRGGNDEVDGATTTTRIRSRVRLRVPKGMDLCRAIVRIGPRGVDGRRIEAIVALSAAGRDRVYERDFLLGSDVAQTPGAPGEGSVTTTDLVDAAGGARLLGRRARAVALPGPGATAPTGTLGFWTDGERVHAASTTPGGRAIYYDRQLRAQGLSTNVFQAAASIIEEQSGVS